MKSVSKEDYIKAIYSFTQDDETEVSNAVIAEELGVSRASASEMARRLSDEKYLIYKKYKGVKLSARGKKAALKLIRRHRLWELFLMKSLGMSWSEVHEEADELEHAASDELVEKIDEYLGRPEFDPHGYPIPDKKGRLPESPLLKKLSNCEPGSSYIIKRVNESDRELMQHFTDIGIALERKLCLQKRLDYDNSVIIKIKGSRHTLSWKAAENIFVK